MRVVGVFTSIVLRVYESAYRTERAVRAHRCLRWRGYTLVVCGSGRASKSDEIE